MHHFIRTVISIVISAMLLAIAVICCINLWMPADSIAWITFGLCVALAAVAIARIALLAKILGNKTKKE